MFPGFKIISCRLCNSGESFRVKTKAFEELKMRKALSYSYIIDDQETFYRDVSEEPGYPLKNMWLTEGTKCVKSREKNEVLFI